MEHNRILIDTSILIDHLRKTKKDETLFYKHLSSHQYFISSITAFEFLIGSTPKNRQFTESLLTELPILPFDSACVKTAATIYKQLKSQNRLISLPDIFIGATSIAHDLPLLTLNEKHFSRIENMKMV